MTQLSARAMAHLDEWEPRTGTNLDWHGLGVLGGPYCCAWGSCFFKRRQYTLAVVAQLSARAMVHQDEWEPRTGTNFDRHGLGVLGGLYCYACSSCCFKRRQYTLAVVAQLSARAMVH